MTKAQTAAAVKDQWRVKDDFGSLGTVKGQDGDEHVLVLWDGEDAPAKVHHNRADRV